MWHYQVSSGTYTTSSALLAAMVVALGEFAAGNAERFAAAWDRLCDSILETAQYLLVRAYAHGSPVLADEAAAYLCDNPARLHTGYTSNMHRAARQVIEAIGPQCSEHHLVRLQEIILGYYSDWERQTVGQMGRAQLTLLDGIPTERRSAAVKRRLAELQRKFGITVSSRMALFSSGTTYAGLTGIVVLARTRRIEMSVERVFQQTQGEGKVATHTHPAVVHTHDHYHVTHHHVGGVAGALSDFDHRAYWHTHEHNHSDLTHSHDYSHGDENTHHAREAHVHDHAAPTHSHA